MNYFGAVACGALALLWVFLAGSLLIRPSLKWEVVGNGRGGAFIVGAQNGAVLYCTPAACNLITKLP